MKIKNTTIHDLSLGDNLPLNSHEYWRYYYEDRDLYDDDYDGYWCDYDIDDNGFCIPILSRQQQRNKSIDMIFGDHPPESHVNTMYNYWPKNNIYPNEGKEVRAVQRRSNANNSGPR